MSYNLVAISGSFRKDSFNTNLLKAFKENAPEGMTIELLDYTDVPLYSQDDEAAFPAVVQAHKEKIQNADGIIISTPEYNRGIPGVLKNFIDYTSRPWGHNSWPGKHVLVTGASTGPIAAALAQYALKQVLTYLDARVVGQPEFYLGTAGEKFSADGTLTDEATKEYIVKALAVLMARIDETRA